MSRRFGITLCCVIGLAALVALPACLFDTREANPPEEGEDVVPLDSPEKPFVAMEKALEGQKDANYERAISAIFVFSPTLEDSLDQNFVGTGVFDSWNKTVEMDVLALLLADAQTIKVAFNPTPIINEIDFVRYRVEYALEVVTTAAPTDTTTYEGVAHFDVRNEGGNWRVTFWDEVETVGDAATWGFLKGILRLRLS